MKVFDDAAEAAAAVPGAWLSIGNFDGMHAGHRRVIAGAVQRAKDSGRPSLAMTFRPHPAAVLSPRGAPPALASDAQEQELFAAASLDAVLMQRFDLELAAVTAEEFCERWLRGLLRVAGVVVGSSFRFGAGRKGDVALLRSVLEPHVPVHSILRGLLAV